MLVFFSFSAVSAKDICVRYETQRCSYETLGTTHQVTQHHIPEDWDHHLHCQEKLKRTCTLYAVSSPSQSQSMWAVGK